MAQAPAHWVVIGRLGKPHGIKGELTVEVRSDSPEVRFADGAHLLRVEEPPLVVESTRWHQGRLLLRLPGVADRNAAELLRGTWLHADPTDDPPVDDGSFADHDLVGLQVLHAGVPVGTVSEVLHPPGADLLAVRRPDGGELLVPFVLEVVPDVDLAAGTLTITPPEGLLEL